MFPAWLDCFQTNYPLRCWGLISILSERWALSLFLSFPCWTKHFNLQCLCFHQAFMSCLLEWAALEYSSNVKSKLVPWTGSLVRAWSELARGFIVLFLSRAPWALGVVFTWLNDAMSVFTIDWCMRLSLMIKPGHFKEIKRYKNSFDQINNNLFTFSVLWYELWQNLKVCTL